MMPAPRNPGVIPAIFAACAMALGQGTAIAQSRHEQYTKAAAVGSQMEVTAATFFGTADGEAFVGGGTLMDGSILAAGNLTGPGMPPRPVRLWLEPVTRSTLIAPVAGASITGTQAQTSLSNGTDTTAFAGFRANGNTQNKVAALDNFAIVPEPSTLAVLLGGVGMLVAHRSHRSRPSRTVI